MSARAISLPVSSPVSSRVSGKETSLAVTGAGQDKLFLILIYFGSLAVRLVLGASIYYAGYTSFFAGDADTYDTFGWLLAETWAGKLHYGKWLIGHVGRLGFNGMYYWVASLYTVIGHSPIGAAAIQCGITSLTPVLVYHISHRIYGSRKAARYCALLTAFLPSMIIWSCLLLKDPLVVFLVCVTVLCTLKMQQELKIRYLLAGFIAMLLVFPIRGYVFYFVLLSVVGTLLMSRFGKTASLTGYMARLGGLALICIILLALGFDKIASEQINAKLLDQVQASRLDLSRSARSGFEEAADVSTIGGALAFLPKGIIYLLFAPFPWQGGSLRMMLALPETLLWYALFPYCLIGIVYTARKHLRYALVVFLFVVQLTCFYGVFIGNVGTAHRQRTQVYVFYLIFTSAGLVYSKRKNRQILGTIQD